MVSSASQAAPFALTEFTLFPQLLPELQIKVWTFAALAGPKVVPITVRNDQIVMSKMPSRALLGASYKSREAALKFLQKVVPDADNPVYPQPPH